MIKMQIIMDEEKILREKEYNLSKIYAAMDNFFLDTLHLRKGENGFYLGCNSKDDFANFGRAMSVLRRQPWFLPNVQTWLYFNSDDTDDPEEFVIEDFKEFCIRKYGVLAAS